jgi:hypothetical protein
LGADRAALLIGLAELLLQLVAEGHQIGPNSNAVSAGLN